MQNSEWMNKTWQFSELTKIANRDKKPIVQWLTEIGVIPPDVKWMRASTAISTTLNPRAITGLYLAESAREFDILCEGNYSTPENFIAWLSFEVSGTPQNTGLKQMLENLGREDAAG